MIAEELSKKLYIVDKIASGSRLRRFLSHPLKYGFAIFFREIIYKFKKKEFEIESSAFFGEKMNLLLPSGTDIYLTGGKAHDSEIRLARFLIHNLKEGDTFVDIGAHFGYFSLLARCLVGKSGAIYSFEASPSTFKMLNKNIGNKNNIECYNLAVSDEVSELKFYEFPNLYSEYNTLEIQQFRDEKWFKNHPPQEIRVKSVTLEGFLANHELTPDIIKIDVEGAESKVINGLKKYLSKHSPLIILEYLSNGRGNLPHRQAEKSLSFFGYKSFAIEKNGKLKHIPKVAEYLNEKCLESDNIVFIKERVGKLTD
jgi:FkbM family methyltransferase